MSGDSYGFNELQIAQLDAFLARLSPRELRCVLKQVLDCIDRRHLDITTLHVEHRPR